MRAELDSGNVYRSYAAAASVIENPERNIVFGI